MQHFSENYWKKRLAKTVFLGEKGKWPENGRNGEKGKRNRMPGKGKRQSPRSEIRAQVKGSSTPGRVAGAIASCLRDGVCCQVSVVGAEAMLKAILAIAFCSTYLETDPSSFSLMLWPDFDTIHVGEERLSGVSLYIVPARR